MSDLATRQSDAISLPPSVHLTSKGLVIASMTKPDFMVVGRFLGRVDEATQWALGDWVNSHDLGYGDLKRICEVLGLVYATVMNCASVCRRFTFSRRRENLRFSHHEAVAALSDEEQDELLDKAEKHGWSLRQIRASVEAKRQLSGNLLGDDGGETLPAPGTFDSPDDSDAVPPAAGNGEAGESLDDRIAAAGELFDTVLNRLGRLKTEITELSEMPFGELLAGELESIDRHRKDIYRFVRFSRPFAACVCCGATGRTNGRVCRGCKGRTWLTEEANERVIKAVRT